MCSCAPGELRHAEWSEFDLDAAVWTIPAHKTKMRRAHSVPLSRQALAIPAGIETDARLSPLLFPSLRSAKRPMSENTINAALRRLGYDQDEMTGHDFREMASILLNEMGKWNPDAIERKLAHADGNKVRRAYAAQSLPSCPTDCCGQDWKFVWRRPPQKTANPRKP